MALNKSINDKLTNVDEELEPNWQEGLLKYSKEEKARTQKGKNDNISYLFDET